MTIMGKCREVLAAYGVKQVLAVMVLLAMAYCGWDYQRSLEEVAEYRNIATERAHSCICYWMLAAGIEIPAATWFASLVKEVEVYEDGISFAEGG